MKCGNHKFFPLIFLILLFFFLIQCKTFFQNRDYTSTNDSTEPSLYDGQFDPDIKAIINQTNLDSLINNVLILSGEDSVWVDSSKIVIQQRERDPGNDLAANYILQRLKKYNLQLFDQQYSRDGRNIIGAQKGKLYPEKLYIICAHYDAVDYYCADDNASGVAAVLEAARILSKYQFEYSLVYAFWDQEETGGQGSRHFAFMASESEIDILGVINVDMIGWDGNHDGLFDIHSYDVANSDSLAEMLLNMNLIYNLPLDPIIYYNSRLYSDQRSFWDNDYPALLIIEAYYGHDFNPYYHSEEDRIDKFNLNYFYNLSKLSIAAISNLAKVVHKDLSY